MVICSLVPLLFSTLMRLRFLAFYQSGEDVLMEAQHNGNHLALRKAEKLASLRTLLESRGQSSTYESMLALLKSNIKFAREDSAVGS